MQGEVAAQGLALAGLAAERDACRAAAASSEERLKARPAMLHARWGCGLGVHAMQLPKRLKACPSLHSMAQAVDVEEVSKMPVLSCRFGQQGYSSHRKCLLSVSGYLPASGRRRRRPWHWRSGCCKRAARSCRTLSAFRSFMTNKSQLVTCKQAVAAEAVALDERVPRARSVKDCRTVCLCGLLTQPVMWMACNRRWRRRRWRWRSGCCRRAARS